MGKMQQVEQISPAKLMWQMTRPHTLTATFTPIILGTVIAMAETSINWVMFTALMIACLCLQIATNLFNEYYDFKRGLDTADSVGIGGGIVRHGLKPQTVLNVAFLLYAIAAGIGVYICMNSSWWLVVIGLFGMAVGYLYTGGPLPIAYTPFGELFSGVLMGAGFVLIAYFVQTDMISTASLYISLPIAVLVGAINMSNNIRDIEEDIIGGRKTLPILLGRERAITVLGLSFIFVYVWIIGLVVFNIVSPWAFITFLSVFKPYQAWSAFRRGAQHMRVAMKSTALTNTFYSLCLAIGLFIAQL